MGDVQGGSRKRAVGTRDRIMAYLARVGEVSEHSGKASTVLAATIGYPGSSVAFAQLLTGMERAGLIQREIRGKRTYRIIPGPAAPPPDQITQPAPVPDPLAQPATPTKPAAAAEAVPAPVAAGSAATRATAAGPAKTVPAASVSAPAGPAAGESVAAGSGATGSAAAGSGATGSAAGDLDWAAGPAGLDYDELARRLLVQVVRRLAGPDSSQVRADPGTDAEPGAAALQETVASLEQKLASATSRQRRLAEENARLREQLRAAEQSLAEAQERASTQTRADRFDSAEVLLLERLLAPLREERHRPTEAGAG